MTSEGVGPLVVGDHQQHVGGRGRAGSSGRRHHRGGRPGHGHRGKQREGLHRAIMAGANMSKQGRRGDFWYSHPARAAEGLPAQHWDPLTADGSIGSWPHRPAPAPSSSPASPVRERPGWDGFWGRRAPPTSTSRTTTSSCPEAWAAKEGLGPFPALLAGSARPRLRAAVRTRLRRRRPPVAAVQLRPPHAPGRAPLPDAALCCGSTGTLAGARPEPVTLPEQGGGQIRVLRPLIGVAGAALRPHGRGRDPPPLLGDLAAGPPSAGTTSSTGTPPPWPTAPTASA